MSYSRAHPSSRYLELRNLYCTIHERGESFLGIPPERTFPGSSLRAQAERIKHCPEQDIPWIIEEIFSYATRFVFANVVCYPARKRLPTGENAHCTIKPVEWWGTLIEGIAERRPSVVWEVWIQSRVDGPQGAQYVEEKVGNAK